jgi:hypothetical protein
MMKEKEAVMTYGMFTEAGNQAVQQIVDYATGKLMTFEQADGLLTQLSRKAGFEEATDTEVRESVYLAMNQNIA